MASAGVNTLRWGALVFGAFYGFSHQSGINSRDKAAAAKQEYEHKQHLINDAKAAWQKKNAPPQASSSSGLITDPNDPKFDLEAYITQVQKDSP